MTTILIVIKLHFIMLHHHRRYLQLLFRMEQHEALWRLQNLRHIGIPSKKKLHLVFHFFHHRQFYIQEFPHHCQNRISSCLSQSQIVVQKRQKKKKMTFFQLSTKKSRNSMNHSIKMKKTISDGYREREISSRICNLIPDTCKWERASSGAVEIVGGRKESIDSSKSGALTRIPNNIYLPSCITPTLESRSSFETCKTILLGIFFCIFHNWSDRSLCSEVYLFQFDNCNSIWLLRQLLLNNHFVWLISRDLI